jgi:hypothetical protein
MRMQWQDNNKDCAAASMASASTVRKDKIVMVNAIMGMKDYNDTAASASVARNNNDAML